MVEVVVVVVERTAVVVGSSASLGSVLSKSLIRRLVSTISVSLIKFARVLEVGNSVVVVVSSWAKLGAVSSTAATVANNTTVGCILSADRAFNFRLV